VRKKLREWRKKGKGEDDYKCGRKKYRDLCEKKKKEEE